MIRILKVGDVKNEEIFARTEPKIDVEGIVADIIKDVRENGDSALLKYTEKFDRAKLETLEVSASEMQEALDRTDPKLLLVMEKVAGNIRKFHERQIRNSFIINDEAGIVIGQKVIPVDRAGLYVPGGTAPLSSTVLMDAIPAKIAGVQELVMMTPPGPD